ncbi:MULTISPECIES: GNAT family N-acetyltransferase [Jannaschia]|nr:MULTISPECIES: GNAT family N-acyltransferase [unclassified Jannaschia]
MEIDAGRLRARVTDLAGAEGALDLRGRVFRGGGCDRDAFDSGARHLVIEDPEGVVGCARLEVQREADIQKGYTAQFYDLTAFAAAFRRVVEVGRICLDPRCADPDAPRLLLATLARLVVRERALALYGCASFPLEGTGLSRLTGQTAPETWAPGRKAPETRDLTGPATPLPPLLRSYLSLGARVSDHGVVDRDLGTVHVCTALPIADIPPRRAKLLRGMLAAA